MKAKDLLLLGVPLGAPMGEAFTFISAFCQAGGTKEALAGEIAAIVADPAAFQDDALRGGLAASLLAPDLYLPGKPPAPWRQWGTDIDDFAIRQIEMASLLPISVAAALLPDAHVGYGLPVGGVLATEGAVIPYAVGVDIACRMKMSVLDLPVSWLDHHKDRLTAAVENETRFGVGSTFRKRRAHDVLDEDWSVSPITARNKDRAWAQLGTSGSGNHFVEFGILTVTDPACGIESGEYLALLSHSGSRGTGAAVCDHYSKLAMSLHSELPRELSRLAWLALDSAEGREYWDAMNLMGRYAAANHALIHRHIAAALGAEVRLDVENHHNFAWEESHFEKDVIVHRKGATPAGPGVLGIIPGSMATPGFLVRGKGDPDSLHSASHGAGRAMSRTRANETLSWHEANAFLRERGVTLLSSGLDEVPACYKDIEAVMAAQTDLVEVLARFDPKLVKMCPSGERPED
ncbi:MAG TPA: RtcB family protein [Terrimicrobiaceae bacterium]|nr:RtcB family protein [Terrimicrobiaceae bacterium]